MICRGRFSQDSTALRKESLQNLPPTTKEMRYPCPTEEMRYPCPHNRENALSSAPPEKYVVPIPLWKLRHTFSNDDVSVILLALGCLCVRGRF